MTTRSLVQRSCVLLGLVGLSVLLFYTGKGHTLILDTNAVTLNGQELKSAETIEVSVDGKEPESMGRAERVMLNVAGPRHTISIEVVSGGDKKVSQRFALPTFMDTAVVSIPAILNDAPREAWVTKFVPPPVEDTPAEQMQKQEDAPASGSPAPGSPAPAAPAPTNP